MKLHRICLCPNDDLITMLEWTISLWQFTAKIWSDTKCNKSLTQNHVVLELSSKAIRKWKWLLRFWNWPVFSAVSTEGLNDVILYLQPVDKKKNRGFCFLEYEDHKTAAQARRRLMSGKVKVWGNLVTVEWADPLEDPDPEVMAKVRVVPRTTVVCECCSPDPLSADAEFCLAITRSRCYSWGTWQAALQRNYWRKPSVSLASWNELRNWKITPSSTLRNVMVLWRYGQREQLVVSDHSGRWFKMSHYFHRLWLTSMAKTSRASTLKLFLPSLLIRRGKSAKLRDKLLKHTCKCCVS